MIDFDIDISRFNKDTWRVLQREIQNNKDKQSAMCKDLYCMWFPNKKDIINICRIALDDINLKCDKIVQSVTLNNSVDKEYSIRTQFEQIHKKLQPFNIKFDDEYVELKVEEIKLQYEYLWAKKIQKDIENDEKELIKEQEREEKLLLKEKEQKERELSKLQYDYAKRVQNHRPKEELDNLDSQIKTYKKKIEDIDYSLLHTRAGYVYVVSNDSYSDERYKIGVTRREVEKRMKELANAAVPFDMNVNGYVFVDDIFEIESKMHNALDQYRINKVNKKREWFQCSLDIIKQTFKNVCNIDITLKEIHNDDWIYSKNH